MEGETNVEVKLSKLSKEYWISLLKDVDLYESDLKNVVMNYLTIYGYKEVVKDFSNEAHFNPIMPPESITIHNKIRKHITDGNWYDALQLINSISEKILKKNHKLNFSLKQQQLLEMIKEGKALNAIEFAQNEITPFILENQTLLTQLEDTLSLLAFDSFKSAEAKKILNKVSLAENFLDLIDEAIFEFYLLDKEPIMNFLIKNVLHTQSGLQSEMNCFLPFIDNFENGKMLLNGIFAKQCDELIFQSIPNIKSLSHRLFHFNDKISHNRIDLANDFIVSFRDNQSDNSQISESDNSTEETCEVIATDFHID